MAFIPGFLASSTFHRAGLQVGALRQVSKPALLAAGRVKGPRHRLQVAGRVKMLSAPQRKSCKAVREELLRGIEEPTAPRALEGAAEEDPAAPLALAVASAADARKARDITALRVSHLTSATSFFVNAVGRSNAQIKAIVKNVEDELGERFGRVGRRQGKAEGGWVCLDYDDVIVNVFSEREREFYGIEKIWSAAQPLDLSDVLQPNNAGEDVVVAAEGVDEEDDWGEDDWTLDDDWTL